VEFELSIPSDVRYIEGVVDRVMRMCEARAFSPRHCHLNVPVALTEALSNAILYGNGGDAAKHVTVRTHVDDWALVIEVADEGVGFDLDACTVDPERTETRDREDGRGLFLMRRLMDEVERFTSGGNVVRLTLRRP
jgi:serine/threonine-protein kinase RsbW